MVHGFTSPAQTHSFPVADLGTEILKVSVNSIPRLAEIPKLKCQDDKRVRKKTTPDQNVGSGSKVKSSTDALSLKARSAGEPGEKWSKKTEGLRRISPELFQDTRTSLPEENHTMPNKGEREGLGAIPKRRLLYKTVENQFTAKPPIIKKLEDRELGIRSSSPDVSEMKMSFKSRPLPLLPDDSTNQRDPELLVSRLPSPKVLFTTAGKSTQKIYKKRHLVLDSPEGDQGPVLGGGLQSLVRPLGAEELDKYLASLSQHQAGKGTGTSLSNIPTMHCNFFVGDEGLFSSPAEIKVCDLWKTAERETNRDPGDRRTSQSLTERTSSSSVVCKLTDLLSSESHDETESAKLETHDDKETGKRETGNQEVHTSSQNRKTQRSRRKDIPVADAEDNAENHDAGNSSVDKMAQKLKLKGGESQKKEWSYREDTEVLSRSDEKEISREECHRNSPSLNGSTDRNPKLSPESSGTLSLFDDFVDDIYDIKSNSRMPFNSIPCVNSVRGHSPSVNKSSASPVDGVIIDHVTRDQNQALPDPTKASLIQNEDGVGGRYSDIRPTFKKSFSEPEQMSGHFTLSQLNELRLSPEENLSDLDSVLSKSFHDILSLDKSSSDSTPTNSLSDSNGFLQVNSLSDSNGFLQVCDTQGKELVMKADRKVCQSKSNCDRDSLYDGHKHTTDQDGFQNHDVINSCQKRESEKALYVDNRKVEGGSKNCITHNNRFQRGGSDDDEWKENGFHLDGCAVEKNVENGFQMDECNGLVEKDHKDSGVKSSDLEIGSSDRRRGSKKNDRDDVCQKTKSSLCRKILKKELHRSNKVSTKIAFLNFLAHLTKTSFKKIDFHLVSSTESNNL